MEYGVARVRRGFPCGNRPPEIGKTKTLLRYSCKSPLSSSARRQGALFERDWKSRFFRETSRMV